MLENLFYHIENKWVEIPPWARYFIDAAAAGVAGAVAPDAGARLILCLAVPSRSYAAALAACGIIASRAALPLEQSPPAKHFELICSLPNGTPVSLLTGNKIKKGVFDGCADLYGMKCVRIMVEQQSTGGGAHFVWEADALRVEVLPAGPVLLPKRQSGRPVSPAADFIRHILGYERATAFARQSQLECVIIGRVNALRREIVQASFAAPSSRNVYHEGCLQHLLRVRKFLNGSESYKSDICRVNGHAPAFAKDGIIPSFVVFDGATGFIRWHDHLRASNWIVILDRTDVRFREATEVLNQAYLARVDDGELPHLPPPPPGVEVMSFYERRH